MVSSTPRPLAGSHLGETQPRRFQEESGKMICMAVTDTSGVSFPGETPATRPRGNKPATRLRALLTLCRPLNCVITVASAGVGGLTGNTDPLAAALCAAALSAGLITAAGNTFNDRIDIDIDRINRPARPLPAGLISPVAASFMAALLSLTGLVLALLVSRIHAIVALLVVATLILYSLRLKRTPLWGNLAVASMAAVVFPYGAMAAGTFGRSWIPAGLAFLFHVGREIIKDIEDITGDRAGRAGTLPVRCGTAAARWWATVVLLVLVVFTALPAVLGTYGAGYALPVSALNVLVLSVLWQLHRQPGAVPDGRLGRQLKAGMLLGLAAVVAGEVSR